MGNNWLYGYQWLLERCGPTGLAVVGTALVHLATYWVTSGAFLVIDVYFADRLAHYKVQPDVRPTRADHVRCAKQVLWNQFFVAMPYTYAQHQLNMWRSGGTYMSLETWPTFTTFLVHIFFILLIEECLFYYTHRLAHHPALYRHVHKRHHEFTAPMGMAAIYCHPLEHFLCNLMPAYMGPLLCGSHFAIASVWNVLAVVNTINTHSGYHFPLLPSPEGHDFHHAHFTNNFGVLGILDWLHGTDVDFRASDRFDKHVIMWGPREAPPRPPRKAGVKK